MNITLHELQDERQRLTKDFDELKNKIQKVEVDLGAMKGNLNAINGAVQFATNLMHVNRDEVLPVALYTEDEPALVSPAYKTFEVIDEEELLPEFED